MNPHYKCCDILTIYEVSYKNGFNRRIFCVTKMLKYNQQPKLDHAKMFKGLQQ